MTDIEKVQTIVDRWRSVLAIADDLPILVQVGDVEEVARAYGMAYELALGFTIGNRDNTEFAICIDTKAIDDPKLEHVVVHELVHVWSFSQVGDDLRTNMEVLTDELARILIAQHAGKVPCKPK